MGCSGALRPDQALKSRGKNKIRNNRMEIDAVSFKLAGPLGCNASDQVNVGDRKSGEKPTARWSGSGEETSWSDEQERWSALRAPHESGGRSFIYRVHHRRFAAIYNQANASCGGAALRAFSIRS